MIKTSESRNELLGVHLAEYRAVQDFILQLRDQLNKLTNYGLIAIGALLAAVTALLDKQAASIDVYLLLDFGALSLFTILAWQSVYADRTMLRLDDYLMHSLKPAIREVLYTLDDLGDIDISVAKGALLYEDYFFRAFGKPTRGALQSAPWIDGFYAVARYAVPIFGMIVTISFEILVFLHSIGIGIVASWNTSWRQLPFALGIPGSAAFLTLGAAGCVIWLITLVAFRKDVQRLRQGSEVSENLSLSRRALDRAESPSPLSPPPPPNPAL